MHCRRCSRQHVYMLTEFDRRGEAMKGTAPVRVLDGMLVRATEIASGEAMTSGALLHSPAHRTYASNTWVADTAPHVAEASQTQVQVPAEVPSNVLDLQKFAANRRRTPTKPIATQPSSSASPQSLTPVALPISPPASSSPVQRRLAA
jgi:hypothetical protein